MSVGSICTRNVDTAREDETITVAAERMKTRKVGTLVVVDEEDCPVGLLTDRDIVCRVVAEAHDSSTTEVGEAMTADPRTVREQTPVEDALKMMRSLEVRRLPVVDGEGALAGIVSLDDVLRLLLEEMTEVGELLSMQSPDSLA